MLYIYILVDKERIKIEAIVSMKILIEALKDVNRMSISLFFCWPPRSKTSTTSSSLIASPFFVVFIIMGRSSSCRCRCRRR